MKRLVESGASEGRRVLGSPYLDWYRAGPLSPYLRAHRVAGSLGHMIEAQQPAGDMSDPAVPELVLIRVHTSCRVHADFGAGTYRGTTHDGELFLGAPDVASSIEVDSSHRVRVLALSLPRIRELLPERRDGGNPLDLEHLHRGPFRHPRVLALLDHLWDGVDGEDGVTGLLGEGLALAICAELARSAGRPMVRRSGGLAPWQVRRVTEYIEARLADEITLGELAGLVGLTTSHVCRAFKESTGMPPHRWQIARRMERAAELLIENELSVLQIAIGVGYASPGQFAAAFRKHHGASPTQYRRQRL